MNLYEIIHPVFKWPSTKKIKVFETFAGVGAQAKALENLHINHEVTGISEIDKDAIVSYASIHCNLNEKLNSFDFPSREDMIEYLQRMDVGFDFKNNRHTITKKTNIEKLKKYYLANILSKNLGNISLIHIEDMPDVDFLTYSFPCQDLSRSGRMMGMDKEAHTRSGLLWEIERLLDEANLVDRLPHILVMENVPEVIGTRNIKNFKLWYSKLESLGYQSYYKIIDAKNHGIPQHRERCFMVSILGNYSYQFPRGKKILTKVLDIMEPHVDESFFLSQNMIDSILGIENNHDGKSLDYLNIPIYISHESILSCINVNDVTGKRTSQTNRIFLSSGVAATITCGYTGYYLVDKDQLPIHYDEKKIGLLNHMYVRKLTVLEAFRLMSFDDEDVEKMKLAGVSNHQLYRQAGNSIVVDVLEALFKQLFE